MTDAAAPAELRQVCIALDYPGLFIFAVIGALVVARARQDIVTGAFLAGRTGLRGGTIRDLLIGAPVFRVSRKWFSAVCLLATPLVRVLRHPAPSRSRHHTRSSGTNQLGRPNRRTLAKR